MSHLKVEKVLKIDAATGKSNIRIDKKIGECYNFGDIMRKDLEK